MHGVALAADSNTAAVPGLYEAHTKYLPDWCLRAHECEVHGFLVDLHHIDLEGQCANAVPMLHCLYNEGVQARYSSSAYGGSELSRGDRITLQKRQRQSIACTDSTTVALLYVRQYHMYK